MINRPNTPKQTEYTETNGTHRNIPDRQSNRKVVFIGVNYICSRFSLNIFEFELQIECNTEQNWIRLRQGEKGRVLWV